MREILEIIKHIVGFALCFYGMAAAILGYNGNILHTIAFCLVSIFGVILLATTDENKTGC